MVFITRRERFNAAHRLYRADFSDEQNLSMFGKCSNPNWHGHNYDLFVTVRGDVSPETGFVVNLKDLSQLIESQIIEKMDHRNINLEVDFMQGKLASTENIAIGIWDELEAPVRALGGILHCIKVCETENNFVEYFGKAS